ncbi:MAG: mechanosensitive ion channel [Acidobacteriales bacterium]|nr:mechanosensitive ion channel [Terriglobales bacterium]
MKTRQWAVTLSLVILVLLAIIGLILTGEAGKPGAWQASNTAGEPAPLVDEQPLKTARAMGRLASDPEERRYAQQVEKLADNEVDLSFADGLRDATEHAGPATPQSRQLHERVTKAEAQVKADQQKVDQLKKQLAAASGAQQDALQQQLDLMLAQVELDGGELDDAQEELAQSGGDAESRIRRQFTQHEAGEHALDASRALEQSSNNAPEIDYRAGNLLGQLSAWRALQANATQLQGARNEALRDAAALTQERARVQTQVSASKSGEPDGGRQTGAQTSAPRNASPASAADATAAIASMHHFSADQKNLADMAKRIQEHQALAAAYGSWIDIVKAHQRRALNGMIQSALWICTIVLFMYLAGRALDRFVVDLSTERSRMRTLRIILRFTVQAVAVLLVLFVMFGAPKQTPTILGLAGAGLTVALKDFIVAFVGWFVLMGRNGIRVGDWVEINGVVGEVLEISLFRTVLLETGNWTDTGHPTGRQVAFVNSYAIEGHFFNFSTSGQWLWDEIEILIPSDQDPYPTIDAIQKMVTKETEADAKAAEAEWKQATVRHSLQSVSATPAVNLKPTTAGVEVHVRYITHAHERFATRAKLYQALVALLHQKTSSQESGADTAFSAGKVINNKIGEPVAR